MGELRPHGSSMRWLVVNGLAVVPVLVSVGMALESAVASPVELIASDTTPRVADFWLWVFLGRLHPLAVHFPVALLITAAIAEFGARLIRGDGVFASLLGPQPNLNAISSPPRPSNIATFCVVLGAASAVVATLLGWLNAESQDFSGAALELASRHRIAGIATTVIASATALLALRLRTNWSRRIDVAYQLGLGLGVVGVGIAGHLGGSIVFGDDYLTSALPFMKNSVAVADLPIHRGDVDFIRDVQPIFEANCNVCHGPDKQKGQLRLDARHLAVNGGRSRSAIVPGSGGQSTLISRVLGQGVDRRMPLHEESLPPRDISILNAWIEQGANWPDEASLADAIIEQHWAYVAPVPVDPPRVEMTNWVRNPIDAFILARLEEAGLTPSPEAGREILIRRLSLDLIGLPPSIAEVDAFLADESPDAYERVVDRLLASPHYGEKWASHWLDLARYADSEGFDGDNERSIWKYRDWVINAFNQDMPFDRFTIEQIAGDMLPEATDDQRIATGFHRNTMYNREAGIDYEEAYWESLVDRVSTTSTVWLGSTIACAQCHDHKFDPFSQREYYEFLAFFGNDQVQWERSVGLFGAAPEVLKEPTLFLPTPAQAERQRELQSEISALRSQTNTPTPELATAQSAWEHRVVSAESAWTLFTTEVLKSSSDSVLEAQDDGSILVSGPNPRSDTYTLIGPAPTAAITAIRIDVLSDPSLPQGGPGRYADGEFVLTGVAARILKANAGQQSKPLRFVNAAADSARRGHEITSLINQEAAKTTGELVGWSVEGSGENHRAIFEVGAPNRMDASDRLEIRLEHDRSVLGQLGLGRFRISLMTEDRPVTNLEVPAGILKSVMIPSSQRSPQQKIQLATYYRAIAPSLASIRQEIAQLSRSALGMNVVSTLVMAEREPGSLPTTTFRDGGSYTGSGETVFAAVPAVLHDFPNDRRADRLGLALWLTDDENPLVARVAVNRIWEQIFGHGIVETTEDFGSQGASPSHPALLDWLSIDFKNHDWRLKSVMRRLVTSSTYRQSAVVNPGLATADPANRLLGRGPRNRLAAEHIRDVSLAASGLLDSKIGGESVYPHQMKGVWNFPFSSARWATSPAPDRYRRSLYTHWRRTAPHPSLVVFDVPSREFCTARRVATNTPLQALALLNGSDSFDSARTLGRLLAQRDGDLRATAAFGFRRVLSRHPRVDELDRIVAYYKNELRYFRKHPGQLRQFLGSHRSAGTNAPAHAAWSMLATSLLNLDEMIMKQ